MIEGILGIVALTALSILLVISHSKEFRYIKKIEFLEYIIDKDSKYKDEIDIDNILKF